MGADGCDRQLAAIRTASAGAKAEHASWKIAVVRNNFADHGTQLKGGEITET